MADDNKKIDFSFAETFAIETASKFLASEIGKRLIEKLIAMAAAYAEQRIDAFLAEAEKQKAAKSAEPAERKFS